MFSLRAYAEVFDFITFLAFPSLFVHFHPATKTISDVTLNTNMLFSVASTSRVFTNSLLQDKVFDTTWKSEIMWPNSLSKTNSAYVTDLKEHSTFFVKIG